MKIEVYNQRENQRKEFSFDKDSVLVGRGKDCELRIIAEGVSRKHAKIYKEGDKVFIEDLGSSNGTFINEKKIQKEQFTSFFPAVLGHGVELRLLDI